VPTSVIPKRDKIPEKSQKVPKNKKREVGLTLEKPQGEQKIEVLFFAPFEGRRKRAT
jgi:hypothetical protein